MSERTFRFGVVATQAPSGAEWIDKARRVEALGYDTLVMPDNVAYGLAAFPALATAAAATNTLRIGTYVLANDFRHPVLLAKETATLDFLSGGRVELGIGAGRPDAAGDNRMLGKPFDAGGVRRRRLAESLAIVKGLLAGERVTAPGPSYAATDAVIALRPIQQPHPPILVAGAGRRMLELAGREADIVALGLPFDASGAAAAERIAWVRDAAGDRFGQIELNLNLMAVDGRVPRYLAGRLDAADLVRSGAIAAVAGTPDGMADQLRERRSSLGISYVMVADELIEVFAPVVERLADR